MIGFLLGSGVSLAAQMPSVKAITGRVLSGEGVMHHTDGTYNFGEPLYAHIGLPDGYVPRGVMFLKRLEIEIALYYFHEVGRVVNYEGLYYTASQIRDSEVGEYDNPVVRPFIQRILPEVKECLGGRGGETRSRWRLVELADEATKYIRDVVWNLVSREPSRTDHLDWLANACDDARSGDVDLFTLNHDTVLERCLARRNVQVLDGFGVAVNDVRYWDPAAFDAGTSRVRLFKLHGSVNWFRFRSRSVGGSGETVGIPLDRDIWHTVDAAGQPQMPGDGRPMFLAGTFNKMLQYTAGIYTDLHNKFYRRLQRTKRLVVCGYGFGDKGINARIIEWLHSAADRKIVIVHPRPDGLRATARGAVSRNWDGWKDAAKLHLVVKGVEDVSWLELERELT